MVGQSWWLPVGHLVGHLVGQSWWGICLLLQFYYTPSICTRWCETFYKVSGPGSQLSMCYYIFSDRGQWQLPGTFFQNQRGCSQPKISHFEISKIHSACKLKLWIPKVKLKNLSPPTVFELEFWNLVVML